MQIRVHTLLLHLALVYFFGRRYTSSIARTALLAADRVATYTSNVVALLIAPSLGLHPEVGPFVLLFSMYGC